MWDKHQERLGSTQPTRKIITLNKAAVALNCPRVILDALYHEIAHAKVGTQHGHDEVWQELCLSLGGNGQPFIDRTVIKMP